MDDPSTAASVPEAVAYVRDLFEGFGAPWLLCGGWAADSWLGRTTREHFDVDIAVFHHDQSAILPQFPGWALVGHDPNVPDETTEQWNGRPLDMPAHIHFPERGSPLSTSATLTHSEFEFEILLNEATDQHWILNRDLDISLPREQTVRTSPWGLPTATPEVIVFFKGGGNRSAAEWQTRGTFRPRDEADFFALLPILTGEQRAWLRDSFGKVTPDHPWLPHLAVGSGPYRGDDAGGGRTVGE